MLSVNKVKKVYEMQSGNVIALNNVDIDFEESGLAFILGKSGSGKTTLLNILSGLDKSTSGNVVYRDFNINDFSEKDMDKYRNTDIGIVFQDYNLLETMTVYDNIAIALEIQKENNAKIIRNKVSEVLEYVDLKGYEHRKVTELSGGQRQRIAIARALVKNPRIILADEPTGNLDHQTGIQVMELLKTISRNCLVIVITHDESIAQSYGDAILRMSDGNIETVSKNASQQVIYDVVYDDKQNVPSKFFSENELSDFIISLLNQRKDIELKIRKTENKIESVSEKPDKQTCFANSKNMPKRRLCYLAFKNFSQKPIRVFFVTLLFALSLTLLMATLHISRFNYDTVMANYLGRYQIEEVYLQKNVAYTDSMFKENTNVLTNGSYYKSLIDNNYEGVVPFKISNKLGDIYTLAPDGTIVPSSLSGGINFVIDNGLVYEEETLSEGSLPQKADEIAITDYIAREIFPKEKSVIGKPLYISGVQAKICGVIKTDYISYNFAYKKKYTPEDDYMQYHRKRNYEIIVIKESFLDLHKEKNPLLLLEYGNFTMPDRDIDFNLYPDIYYCGTETLLNSDSSLLAGRMPDAENEVLVSDIFYNRYMNGTSDDSLGNTVGVQTETDNQYNNFKEETYDFVNLYSDKYNKYFSDCINVYDYLESVKVVGVYSTDVFDEISHTDIVIMQQVYDKMFDDYYNNLIISDWGVSLQQISYKEFVDICNNLDIIIDEPSITRIYLFRDTIIALMPVLQILLFITLAIVVLVLFSFVTFSINSNSKQIGILRSIGATKADTVKIFVIETGIITVLALITSYILDIVLVLYVNDMYIKSLTENPFPIIILNAIICFVIPIITIVLAMLSSAIPIRILSKKSPIEIIRSSKQ